MSEAAIAERPCDTGCHEGGEAVSLGVAEWLSFAATPSFAAMALLTAAQSGGLADSLCSTAHEASPLGGMLPMYVLMGAFHSTPWVKLVSRRRRHPPKTI